MYLIQHMWMNKMVFTNQCIFSHFALPVRNVRFKCSSPQTASTNKEMRQYISDDRKYFSSHTKLLASNKERSSSKIYFDQKNAKTSNTDGGTYKVDRSEKENPSQTIFNTQKKLHVFSGTDLLEMEDFQKYKKNTKHHLQYNYGLPGIGKGNFKKIIPPSVKVVGEVLFGLNPVALALQQKRRQIYKLYIKKNVRLSNEKVDSIAQAASMHGVTVKEVTTGTLEQLSSNRPHQGVCLDVGKLDYRSIKIDDPYFNGDGRPALYLLLDHIQDPMNYGSVLRSAYFLGVDKVITVKGDSCPMSPVVSKASAGAMEVVTVHQVDSALDFVMMCKKLQWQVISTQCSLDEDDSETSERKSDFNHSCPRSYSLESFVLDKPSVLVIGNEGTGVSINIHSLCDVQLSITPGKHQTAGIDSLNASVATGVLLHSLLKKC